MNKNIFAILGLILLLTGGVFLVQKSKVEKASTPDTSDTQQEQTKQLSQAACDMTSNYSEINKIWKMHSNESPKFSFSYPETWSKDLSKKEDGEVSIALYDPKMNCSVEGSPALCGIHISLYPITSGESVNVKYLQRMREAEQAGQAGIKNICVAGKEAIEITDHLRHEIIFDREGYSFMITAENYGSDNFNKKFWDVVDSIGSELHFE